MMKCEICGREFKSFIGLGCHVSKIHKLPSKEYYDKYLKKDGEGICKREGCSDETFFKNMNTGYSANCSHKCSMVNKDTTQKRRNTMKERYGVEYYTTADKFQEKSKQTCLDKYGVEYSLQSDEIKEKSKQTCLNKYGVENYSQTDEHKEKYKETCLERYGVENSLQSGKIREKSKKTMLERYGVESYFAASDFKEKYKQTSLEKYGVEHPSQNEEVREKFKQTCLEKYGVEHISQTDEFKEKFKQTCLEKYGVEHPLQNDEVREKIKSTILERYGVEHIFQLNQNPSKPQIELFELVQSIFKDAKINDPQLSYSIDVTIPSYKIAIEYDGSYWHEGREEQDKIRQEKLENEGWRFIRYVDRVPGKTELLENIKSLIIN